METGLFVDDVRWEGRNEKIAELESYTTQPVTMTVPVLSPARTPEGRTRPSPRSSEPASSVQLSSVELLGNMKYSAPLISGKIKKCTERKNTFIHGQELGQTFYL